MGLAHLGTEASSHIVSTLPRIVRKINLGCGATPAYRSAFVMLSDYGKPRADYKKCVELADRNSAVSLSAIRTIRRISGHQRRPLDVPGWLPTLMAVAGMAYGVWLVERAKLSAAEFFPIGLALILVIFAAFSLPSITTLELGPAELRQAGRDGHHSATRQAQIMFALNVESSRSFRRRRSR